MQKKMKKAVVVMLSAVTMFSALNCAFAETTSFKFGDNGNIAVPSYILIANLSVSLSENADGSLQCSGSTLLSQSKKAEVIVELQQYKNGWKTIKTWTKSKNLSATVSEAWHVSSGYDYQVKTTHNAYDSNGNLIESVVKYSSIVSK